MSVIAAFTSFQDIAVRLPSGFQKSLDGFIERCCAIHRLYEYIGDGYGGCDEWRYGSHKSISVQVECGMKHCLAEVGQRKLDYDFMSHAFFQSDVYRANFERPNARFRKRYFGGYAAEVSLYGAGYCYLAVFNVNVRSRVARILGPCPWLADVVRLAFVGSSDYFRAVDIQSVGSSMVHVHCNQLGFVKSKVGFLNAAIKILIDNPDCRIGASEEDLEIIAADFSVACNGNDVIAVKKELNSYVNRMVVDHKIKNSNLRIDLGDVPVGMMGLYREIVFSTGDSDGIDIIMHDVKRLKRLVAWFSSFGIDLSETVKPLMMIVTCVPAAYPIGFGVVKEFIRLHAIMGDALIKAYMARYAIAGVMSGVQYTGLNMRATNDELAVLLDCSGLRECCHVRGLDVHSKANADIIEAVIGLLSIHYDSITIDAFLKELGLIPKDVGILNSDLKGFRSGSKESLVSVGLNSSQYDMAIKMACIGLI